MKQEIKKVTQDNRLIEAQYYLSLAEKRLILVAINKAQKGNFKELKINIDDYNYFFKQSDPYRDLKQATERLFERTIYKIEGRESRTRWVSHIEFNEKDKFVSLNFAPEIEPYLFDLKAQFTTYNLFKLSNVGSSYTIRLYELLMQFKKTGELYINVEELRACFGVGDKYPQYMNFKQRCLTPAVKEINQKSDFKVYFYESKKKRRVETLHFKFEEKQQQSFNFSDKIKPKEEIKTISKRDITLTASQRNMGNPALYDLWLEKNKDNPPEKHLEDYINFCKNYEQQTDIEDYT